MDHIKLFKEIRDFEVMLKSSASEDKAIDNYVAFNFKIEHLIMAMPLLNPNFVEFDGLVLNQQKLPQNVKEYVDGFRKKTEWSTQQIEYVINHIHLELYFYGDNESENYSVAVMSELASFIRDCWESNLNRTFPDREFVVEVDHSDFWPVVYFHQT